MPLQCQDVSEEHYGFTKIKVDPAVASGPLISTVNDLVAVVTYYGLAWTLLLNIVHMA